VQKLAKQGVQEQDRFFVLSSAKYNADSFTNEDLNLLLVRLGGDALKAEQRVGLRNYFLQRASLSQSVHSVLASLLGLTRLADVPVLTIDGESTVSSKAAKPELNIKLLNNFGALFTAAKSIKTSLLQVDGTHSTKDVTAKFNKDNTLGTVNLSGVSIGKYRL